MKVLVTGATSLLAEATIDMLVQRGDTVHTLQRRPVREILQGRVVEHQGDICDAAAVREAARGCDAIVHAAAKVGVIGDWEEYRSVNVGGTANVLAAARRHDISRLVHVSTPSVAHEGSSIVGGQAERPSTKRRNAPYAETKAQAELDALAAADSAFGVVAVRPHLVWGPGDTQLVGRIIDRARSGRLAVVGTGSALIDTTYIDNAAAALVAALDAVEPGARCSGRAYVVANNEPRPIIELLEGIVTAAGITFAPRHVPAPVAVRVGGLAEQVWRKTKRADEPPLTRFLAEQLSTAHWFDPRPARDDLGYVPTVSIDEGLGRLKKWLNSEPR